MGADPYPDNNVASTLAYGPILLIDSHRPNVFVSTQLFESKGRDVPDFRGSCGMLYAQPLAFAHPTVRRRARSLGEQAISKTAGIERRFGLIG